eukprot:TRINITY_DN16330_c0_g1_i3.p1 TRINITY_DN16330_c0_g1~~TRINITY_DN16330_c0_g1_i3.p1  ORF type:complete len:360 (+),score=85.38 TRINITY_DN16330_c0_g1_i3:102-1082(+)
MLRSLVGSEMCIRDRYQRRVRGLSRWLPSLVMQILAHTAETVQANRPYIFLALGLGLGVEASFGLAYALRLLLATALAIVGVRCTLTVDVTRSRPQDGESESESDESDDETRLHDLKSQLPGLGGAIKPQEIDKIFPNQTVVPEGEMPVQPSRPSSDSEFSSGSGTPPSPSARLCVPILAPVKELPIDTHQLTADILNAAMAECRDTIEHARNAASELVAQAGQDARLIITEAHQQISDQREAGAGWGEPVMPEGLTQELLVLEQHLFEYVSEQHVFTQATKLAGPSHWQQAFSFGPELGQTVLGHLLDGQEERPDPELLERRHTR